MAFIAEETNVYCAVRTGSLNKMDFISSLKVSTSVYRKQEYVSLVGDAKRWTHVILITSSILLPNAHYVLATYISYQISPTCFGMLYSILMESFVHVYIICI